jgi:hypothetical protein
MKILTLLFLLTTTLFSFSQEATIRSYQQLKTENGVTIYVGEGTYKVSSNNTSHSRYFLKYENTTNQEVTISFNKEMHYRETCYGCDSNNQEQQFSIVIPVNTTYSFDENHNDKRYYIFRKDNNGWITKELTDFSIKNINIKLL